MNTRYLILLFVAAVFLASCDRDIILTDYNENAESAELDLKLTVELKLYTEDGSQKGSDLGIDQEADLGDGSWWVLLMAADDTIRTQVPSDYETNGLHLSEVPFDEYDIVLTNYATETGNESEDMGTDVFADTPGVVDMHYYGLVRGVVLKKGEALQTINLLATPSYALIQVLASDDYADPSFVITNQNDYELFEEAYYFAPPGVVKDITFSALLNFGYVEQEYNNNVFTKGNIWSLNALADDGIPE